MPKVANSFLLLRQEKPEMFLVEHR